MCCPFMLISFCFKIFVFTIGKSWHEKVKEVRGTLTKKKADALVVTALDEVACKEI